MSIPAESSVRFASIPIRQNRGPPGIISRTVDNDGDIALVIIGIEQKRVHCLFQVVGAGNASCFFPGGIQRGKQNSRKYCNNCNYYQELYKGEMVSVRSAFPGMVCFDSVHSSSLFYFYGFKPLVLQFHPAASTVLETEAGAHPEFPDWQAARPAFPLPVPP